MEKVNTINETELDELLGETHTSVYHANHLISDKIIDPKSPNFKKKGESYFITCKGIEQWYFKPKGEEDFIRVKWYQLESNVGEGDYGKAKYVGLNASIYGKVGQLTYTSKKWIFHFDGEKYPLVSPESVEIL